MNKPAAEKTVAYGFAGRAAAVHPGTLGLDVVLLPLAEVAEQPPRAAAGFAHYTFFLGTRHQDARRSFPKKKKMKEEASAYDNGRHELCMAPRRAARNVQDY